MAKKNNDDMAGSVSDPHGAPEVKPAKSLWPKPYQEVRVEPSLEPPSHEDAPAVLPPSPAGDFDIVPDEGYQERHDEAPVAPESELEPVSGPEELAAVDRTEEAESAGPEPDTTPLVPRVEVGPEAELEPEPQAARVPEVEIAAAPDPEPFRVSEDERTAAVFDAADHQSPPLSGTGESRTGRFVAMAAGIVVALALGSVAFVYGASGLGIKFGNEDAETTEVAPPPAPEPVAAETARNEELEAAQARVAELEARLKEIEEQNAAAQAAAEPETSDQASLPPSESEPGTAEQNPPSQESAAAEPPPASEPVPEPKPAPAETARAEPEPDPAPRAEPEQSESSVPVERGAPPRPLAPPQEARVEQQPPPRYDTRPSYNQPRPTPEMPVLQGWAVRDVYNGIAVVQGRGAPIEVEPGDDLPGGNRVLAIRRLGGNWAVITERGIISGY